MGMFSLEELTTLVVKELPSRKNCEEVIDQILRSRDSYDRYQKDKKNWRTYGERRRQIQSLGDHGLKMAEILQTIDLITRDELENKLGKQTDPLIGTLHRIVNAAEDIKSSIQTNGAPRNLDREFWVGEMAEIYISNFKKTPTVRNKFYKLLELSLPDTYVKYGGLDPRQVGRHLDRWQRSRSTQPQWIDPFSQ